MNTNKISIKEFDTKTARVGVMTCALDELACAAFSVGAFVNSVDLYVFIDTGSTDGTPELVEHLYGREIREGQLVVERIGQLPDYDMSIARNRALEILRDHDIDLFIKVDADDVFYDDGVTELISVAQSLPPRTHFVCANHELYQWEVVDNLEWLEAIRNNLELFWEMDFVPSHERIWGVENAIARGKWGDEAAGASPEGIHYEHEITRISTEKILSAHYGWARPLRRKREKIEAWYGDPNADPRVDRLQIIDDWRKPKKKFTRHPEIITRQIENVLGFVKHGATVRTAG